LSLASRIEIEARLFVFTCLYFGAFRVSQKALEKSTIREVFSHSSCYTDQVTSRRTLVRWCFSTWMDERMKGYYETSLWLNGSAWQVPDYEHKASQYLTPLIRLATTISRIWPDLWSDLLVSRLFKSFR